METTLHRQLKALYGGDADRQEVTVDGFRIDAVDGDLLIEIQQASLSAIRRKVRRLLENHPVLVVKPLAFRKYLVQRNRVNGSVISARYSPLRESELTLFVELVHFVDVFPHPRLTLEVLLTEQEEHRLPTRTRRRRKSYRVQDRFLRTIQSRVRLQTAGDLLTLLPPALPDCFTTADLARAADIPRWLAQKMAYCLRQTGAAQSIGKQGHALVYQVRRKRAAA